MEWFNPAQMIYDSYLNSEEWRRSRAHYPSGVCAQKKDGSFIGKCRRNIFYEMTGAKVTDPVEPVALFKMALGSMTHDYVDSIVNKQLLGAGAPQEEVISEEKMFGNEIAVKWNERGLIYSFSGRLDKRFMWRGQRIATEWKSTYGRGIDFIKKDGPREDALLQVMCYLRQKVAPVDQYLLSYIAIDSGYVYSFGMVMQEKSLLLRFIGSGAETEVPWSWADIKRALLVVEESVEMEKPPERDYDAVFNDGVIHEKKSHWRCRYCRYAKLCWEVK